MLPYFSVIFVAANTIQMPLVRVTVKVGSAMLGNHMKPFDSSVTVLTAVHKIISMYERLQLMRVDVYPSGDQPATQRTQLDLEDLHQLELAQLSEFGYFLVAHCVDGAANTTTQPAALGRGAHTPVLQAGGSVALVNTFDVMMAATPLQLICFQVLIFLVQLIKHKLISFETM